MSSANRDHFTAFFPICIPLISLYKLMPQAKTSGTALNTTVVTADLLVWFLSLVEMLPAYINSV